MITSFVQYLLMATSYMGVLNVYAVRLFFFVVGGYFKPFLG